MMYLDIMIYLEYSFIFPVVLNLQRFFFCGIIYHSLYFTALFLFLLTVLIGFSLSFLICFYSFFIYSIDFFPVDLLHFILFYSFLYFFYFLFS